MSQSKTYQPNPELDLVLERVVDVPKELVWRAWTEPELIVKWFTPAPWQTISAEIDLRPGGIMSFVMRSPEGEEFPNLGSVLEAVQNERLVWTTALKPGFRPQPAPPMGFHFSAIIALETQGTGTKYTATVIHDNVEARKQHDEMGFHDGWGKALDQLVELVKTI